MVFLLFLSIIPQIMSEGVVYLPKDMILRWNFTDSSYINFSLEISQSTYDTFDWAGLGFKYTDAISGMYYADLVNIIFGQPIQDCYGVKNMIPPPDEGLGGTNDLEGFVTEFTDTGVTSSWGRKFVTDDVKNDMKFEVDAEYRLLWAVGPLDEITKIQLKHKISGRGTINIVLSQDYYNAQYKPLDFSLFE